MDIQKVLFVGDIDRCFNDSNALKQLDCEVQTDFSDAVNAAAKGIYSTIAIAVCDSSAKMTSLLKVIKAVSPGSRKILLAQMYQEPLALRMIRTVFEGSALADDYLICPIEPDQLFQPESAPSAAITEVPAIKTPDFKPVATDSDLKRMIEKLQKLATTDDLTGLKNRRYIREFWRQIIERAEKTNAQVTLLLFDIDNFKHYNDVYGHSAGDEILKQAAVLIRHCCREHDVVGRIGGDEFAVIFWDDPLRKKTGPQAERRSQYADHPREPIFIAERFRKELGNAELHLLGPQGKGVLTISGGLVTFPRDASTVKQLFEQADMALLDAKRSGKNRIYLVGTPNEEINDHN
jgi:diguanylate cyclase (GGDEF)-like protein